MKGRYLGLSISILLVLIWISLNSGVVKLHNVLGLLMGHGDSNEVAIMQEIRAPRVLAAVLVGATLGIGGALSQGALKNPLAEPTLLGTSGGAALFTLIGVLIFNVNIGSLPAIIFGILGASLATIGTYQLGKRGRDGFAFIIMGLAASATLTALVGITSVIVNSPEARGVTFWSLGTISMVTRTQVLILIPILVPCFIGAWLLASELDYLALGDLRAKHLGKNVLRIRFAAFLVIAISVGAITSIFGQIAFLALAVPHIVRSTFGVRHKYLTLFSALFGATLLLLADLGARTLATPNELPIGLMTALIGAPVLIFSVRNWMHAHA